MNNNLKQIEKGDGYMSIKIIDSIMGSGKSSWAIQEMKKDSDYNYIYITPYLDEIKRIITSIDTKRFYEPKNLGKGKLDSLHKLISEGKDITSTHALFTYANNETIELLKANNYILILDEVIDVVDFCDLKISDIKMLRDESKKIEIDEKGFVKWIDEYYDGKFNHIRDLCYNNSLFMYKNTAMVWLFPTEIFKCFKEVYILTYLFNSQMQKFYFDMFDIKYEYYHIEGERENYKLILDGKSRFEFSKNNIKDLISIIHSDKLNAIGEDYYSLSKSWFNKRKKENDLLIKKLKNNIYNVFNNLCSDINPNDRMWTTFKDYKGIIKGKGYTKGFVSLNARATNQYSNKIILAYVSNRFINPLIINFFAVNNVNISNEQEEEYALSELLQWIWRSRIRNNQDITLYIPSSRMRYILAKWLEK